MWTVVGLLLLVWLGGLLLSLTFGGWIIALPVAALLLAVWEIFATFRRRNAAPSASAPQP